MAVRHSKSCIQNCRLMRITMYLKYQKSNGFFSNKLLINSLFIQKYFVVVASHVKAFLIHLIYIDVVV